MADHTAVLQLVPERAAAAMASLPPPVRAILRLCDGTRPAAEIFALSPLSPERTERVLARLVGLGLVTAPAPAPAARRRLTSEGLGWASNRPNATPGVGFSAAEEAFFAGGIDHLVGDEFSE